MGGATTGQEAAGIAGFDPRRAAYVKAKPTVQAFGRQHRADLRAGLVNHEVEALAKFNINREQILAKWWTFGCIDPALGFNTSSQSRALELLWKGLGYADAEAKKPEEAANSQPDVYVAEWMRKAN